MMRRFVLLLTLATLAGGGFAFWTYWADRPDSTDTITLYGNVEIRDAALAFIEQQRVAEVLVEEGDVVEAGQVLSCLENDRLQHQFAEAQARMNAQQQVVRRLKNGTRAQELMQAASQLRAAEVKLANAKRIAARQERLAQENATSEEELHNARTNLNVALADRNTQRASLELAREGPREEQIGEALAMLEAMKARVALLNTRLNDMVLRSPSPGVIQSRILEVGEIADPMRPAFVLALTDPKWVRVYLPEPQMGQIQQGMSARVFSDSFPARPFTGRIGFISPEAEFTPKSVQTTELRTQLVFEVRVWVDDSRNQLRLGMPVTVKVDPSAPVTPTMNDNRQAEPESTRS